MSPGRQLHNLVGFVILYKNNSGNLYKVTIGNLCNLCYYYSIPAWGLLLHEIAASCKKKEEINTVDSRYGSVETCRNAARCITGGGESICEESVCLES